jgi:hypothetical protein
VIYGDDWGSVGAGLVIDDGGGSGTALRYGVYWFYAGKARRHSGKYLIKLEIPNE